MTALLKRSFRNYLKEYMHPNSYKTLDSKVPYQYLDFKDIDRYLDEGMSKNGHLFKTAPSSNLRNIHYKQYAIYEALHSTVREMHKKFLVETPEVLSNHF